MPDNLNLSDLVDIVQLKNRDLPPRLVEAAVRRIFEEIISGLAGGARFELRGFGVFSVKQYEGHEGRNPRTGALIKVPAKRGVQWRTGKALGQQLADQHEVGE
jgi:integration host factor subunit beta